MSALALLGGRRLRTAAFSPCPQSSPNDAARLMEVLSSGNWGGYPYPNRLAAEFAEKFADAHGAQYGSCVVNGTVALLVAMQAAGIAFGDEVIVPA